ncbi:MAG TPA: 4-(cytidine 5'-diphospho)-2-C-methyl-D-erythritol kinase [Candidatus Didemnitutus sp.]|nr:4-(cytidine 5'-diphospho)-2-C-methyl-D-erythritol kinase [Candidatus Didemnitutus sp.]
MSVTVFSPAKINLFLAVTGRRTDGFHDLVSVVAPLEFGDTLEARSREQGAKSGQRETPSRFSLECDDPAVPTDGTNLILKAATAFAVATGWPGGVHFKLTKRIPMGAGLGGGSSNAVAALRALNRLSGDRASEAQLSTLAGGLGSDCAAFLHHAPVLMRGRGEQVEVLPDSAAQRLGGRSLVVFKPSFGVSTPWAYGRMVARGTDYIAPAEAERRLGSWITGDAPAEELLFNNMEGAAFEKFIALPTLAAKLSRHFGVTVRMSGSGSACFAFVRDDRVTTDLGTRIRECWGPAAFLQVTRIPQSSALTAPRRAT